MLPEFQGSSPGAGFTKPCALLKLDFLTSAYNKCMALVRKSSFSKAQGLRETGPCFISQGESAWR